MLTIKLLYLHVFAVNYPKTKYLGFLGLSE